jgi:adenine-specific DNA-methyltransferase
MTGESLDILANNLDQLKALFPQVFTEGKLDLEKFKATFTDKIHIAGERYVLNWAGKADAFRALQIPATGTLLPQPEESVNFDEAENIFIEGENLEVLKLLQKAYYNKIKCIIIDPPYNTGNDSFIYPDSFKESRTEYEKRVGDKDEEGQWMKEGLFRKNSKDSGHFHSNWLSMMYPRLFLARNLLTDDGVIFVHIDDNEVHNLRLLMNEVFGEENFVASIIWQKKYSPQNDATYFSTMHDYIICVSRNKKQSKNEVFGFSLNLLERTEEQNARYLNIDKDHRGLWKPGDVLVKTYNEKYVYPITTPSGRTVLPPKGRCWRFSEEKFKELVNDNRIWFGNDGNGAPSVKRFLSEVKQGIVPSTLWLRLEVGDNQEAANELKELMNGLFFETPKPTRLIKRILELSTKANTNDIVLDFFGGSGTTAHAVMELNNLDNGNRSFIVVQLAENCDVTSEAYKAGYSTIANMSRERIKRAITKIANSNVTEFGFKSFKLTDSNFKLWRGKEVNEGNLETQLQLFTHPLEDDATSHGVLYELMLKAGIPLTAKVQVMQNSGEWFLIADGDLAIALNTATPEMIGAILQAKPARVLMLDACFANNDQLKTNTVLQMRDSGVEFKTI